MRQQRWWTAMVMIGFALAVLAACGSGSTPVASGGEDETTVDDGTPAPPIDLDALADGTWVLRFGGGPDGDVPLVEGYPITISFDAQGNLSGTAACNGYGGTFDLDGEQFILGDVSWTEMGCSPDVHASESAYLAGLLDVTDLTLSEDSLALGGLSTELIFERQSAG